VAGHVFDSPFCFPLAPLLVGGKQNEQMAVVTPGTAACLIEQFVVRRHPVTTATTHRTERVFLGKKNKSF
jgi:hypothetical protein